MTHINPQVLVWARETAGLSVEEACRLLQLKDSRARTAVDRLLSIERGKEDPGRSLLLKMTKAYRRSLLTLYLETPPNKESLALDFRTLPQRSTSQEPLVDALVRDVSARQQLLKTVLIEEDAPVLGYISSAKLSMSPSVLLSSIIATSGISREEFRRQQNPEKAFAYLRSAFEGIGIFVLLLGNLGTHHTNIDVKAFRGIAISDPIAPFVVINDQDSAAAWSFTLLHEVTHLWLGQTSVSSMNSENESERFCNEVAGAFLAPEAEVAAIQVADHKDEEILKLIGEFAQQRNISHSLVAYRLFLTGKISLESWERLAETLRIEWRKQREREKDARRSKGESGGPDYFVVRRHRLGNAILQATDRGVAEGSLTPTRAAKILGVAPRNVYPILTLAKGRAA